MASVAAIDPPEGAFAGGKGKGLIFRHGEPVRMCLEAELLPAFLQMLREECR